MRWTKTRFLITLKAISNGAVCPSTVRRREEVIVLFAIANGAVRPSTVGRREECYCTVCYRKRRRTQVVRERSAKPLCTSSNLVGALFSAPGKGPFFFRPGSTQSGLQRTRSHRFKRNTAEAKKLSLFTALSYSSPVVTRNAVYDILSKRSHAHALDGCIFHAAFLPVLCRLSGFGRDSEILPGSARVRHGGPARPWTSPDFVDIL